MLESPGLKSIGSRFNASETMTRLMAEVTARGMTVFARVDHAAGAAAAGLALRPTDLLIFGSAKGGTALMQLGQQIGIDLPLKVLVWQDEIGDTWLSYHDMSEVAGRHQLGPKSAAVTSALDEILRSVTNKVAGKS